MVVMQVVMPSAQYSPPGVRIWQGAQAEEDVEATEGLRKEPPKVVLAVEVGEVALLEPEAREDRLRGPLGPMERRAPSMAAMVVMTLTGSVEAVAEVALQEAMAGLADRAAVAMPAGDMDQREGPAGPVYYWSAKRHRSANPQFLPAEHAEGTPQIAQEAAVAAARASVISQLGS